MGGRTERGSEGKMERDEGFGEGETCTQLIIVGSPSGIRTNAHCWDDCGVGQVHGFGCRVTMVICRQTSSLPCHPARKLMHSHTQTHYLLTHVLTLAPYSDTLLTDTRAHLSTILCVGAGGEGGHGGIGGGLGHLCCCTSRCTHKQQ